MEQGEEAWKKHAVIAIAVIAVLAGYSTVKGSEYSGKANNELALSQHWLTAYELEASYVAIHASWVDYYDSLAQYYDRIGDKASSASYRDLCLKTLGNLLNETQRATDNYTKYFEMYKQSREDSAIADSFTLPTMIFSISAVVCASSDVTDEKRLYLVGLAIAALGGGLLTWNIVLIGAIDGFVLIPLLMAVLVYAWWKIGGKRAIPP